MAELLYRLSGEVDVASWGRLQADLNRITSEWAGSVVVDCAALDFIDAGGMAIVLAAAQRVEERGGRFHIAHLTGAPRRVADVLRRADLLPLQYGAGAEPWFERRQD